MTLREALQTVHDKYGDVTPSLVVDVARDESTPEGEALHHALEWDNEICGEAWRRYQARKLIQRFRIALPPTKRQPERSVRAWHAVRTEDGGSVFRPTVEIVHDPFTLRMQLAEMEREWKAMKARYSHLAEFAEMVRRDLADAA